MKKTLDRFHSRLSFLALVSITLAGLTAGCATTELPVADVNGDGKVDDEEWTQYQRKAAAAKDQYDRNNENTRTSFEFQNMMRSALQGR